MTRGMLVVAPGPFSCLQDLGRPGWAHLGVSPSGAADRGAHRLANRLVGNDDAAATIEVTAGGLVLTAEAAALVAVTGAHTTVAVDGVPAPMRAPVRLRPGQRLEVERPAEGLRNHVGVAGGWLVDPVLGSRSRDVLADLGPPPLVAGQHLPVGDAAGSPTVDVAPARPRPSRPLVLRPGPRADWLDDDAHHALVATAWHVTQDADRVGIRLDGPRLGLRDPSRELASEGLVRGAVQVPGDGRPLVFLADHPVTGGYPVVGVVADDDLDALAQLAPGDVVRWRRVPAGGRADRDR